ncbi:predicted protein [Lichtheimia corymbifera JMRC:FSU:9682]|uniref:Uncharacterized protein n=1 Tax=Lichtheimia corymbifera JMRC:FSU:9682 TaxID=1263082 RepID=A0A068RMW1_9FUNG|nr:predicted protein [Lichtheimia corymbifera JMRC:FSU:9682]
MSTTDQDEVYDFSSELIDLLRFQTRHQKQLENAMASVKQDALALIDRCNAISTRLNDTHQKVLETGDACTRTQHSINASLQNDAEVNTLDVLQKTLCQRLLDILDESLGNKVREHQQQQQQHRQDMITPPLQQQDDDEDMDNEHFSSALSPPFSSITSSPRTAPMKSDNEDEDTTEIAHR